MVDEPEGTAHTQYGNYILTLFITVCSLLVFKISIKNLKVLNTLCSE